MIDVKITGGEKLAAGLKKIVPNSRTRINGGALRTAGNAIAEEGNRRTHSPRGRARNYKTYVNPTSVHVSPGNRATFFSNRQRPVLDASVAATHSRVENVIRDVVDAVVGMAFK